MLEVSIVLFISLAGLISIRLWEKNSLEVLERVKKNRQLVAEFDKFFPQE